MAVAVVTPLPETLEQAVSSLVNLGEKDPLTIARKLIERQDDDWLREQMVAYAEDFIADMARRQLGSARRSAEVALRVGDQATSADLKITKAWVPGFGWKRASDLTADDLLARARMYDVLADASTRRATWCREVVDLMVAEGARTLGKLKAALPPLDSPLELVAA